MVVDHLDMKVGGFNVKDKPSQLDRTADILKGEPKDLSLRKIRELKSASGKDLSVCLSLFICFYDFPRNHYSILIITILCLIYGIYDAV